MTAQVLLTALGLALVLEGLMPFLAPTRWRDLFKQIAEFNDGQIRFMGLLALLIGIVLINLA